MKRYGVCRMDHVFAKRFVSSDAAYEHTPKNAPNDSLTLLKTPTVHTTSGGRAIPRKHRSALDAAMASYGYIEPVWYTTNPKRQFRVPLQRLHEGVKLIDRCPPLYNKECFVKHRSRDLYHRLYDTGEFLCPIIHPILKAAMRQNLWNSPLWIADATVADISNSSSSSSSSKFEEVKTRSSTFSSIHRLIPTEVNAGVVVSTVDAFGLVCHPSRPKELADALSKATTTLYNIDQVEVKPSYIRTVIHVNGITLEPFPEIVQDRLREIALLHGYRSGRWYSELELKRNNLCVLAYRAGVRIFPNTPVWYNLHQLEMKKKGFQSSSIPLLP